jgi:glucose/arabinose dehydrogenase
MRPYLRLSVLALTFAVCALCLPVWLHAQPATPLPTAAGQPPAAGQGRGPGAPGAARGQRGATGPAANTYPYLTQPALGGMAFDQPAAIVTAPGDTNRIFVVEKPGRIIVIPDVTKPERVTFLDLTGKLTGTSDGEMGLLALAFHPDWKNNRQFYLWFTVNTTTAAGTGRHERLARFTISATDSNKADPASESPLISQYDQAVNHNGGQLAFGPDGYLYLSLGDEGGANDQYQNSQRIDKDFFAGLLRLDVDKKPGSLAPNPHPSVHAGTYTIPADNPWVGASSFNGEPLDPTMVHTEFYAVGLRNPWRFSFDPVTKLLWLGDVGQDRIEEVNIIRRGGNYGWNYREAGEPFFLLPRGNRRGNPAETTALPATTPSPVRVPPPGVVFDEPVFSYFHPGIGGTPSDTGNSISGGFVYRGRALPALNERYLFADYQTGFIWALGPVQPGNVNGLAAKATAQIIARRSGIASFGLDPVTGDLLIANIGNNVVERLVVNPSPAPVPPSPIAPSPPASP